MTGYPITLVALDDARCVVVGGGAVAARKVAGLRQAGARPIVISPTLCPELESQAAQGEIEFIRRSYRQGDLTEAWLVIAATDAPAVNEAVFREAQAVGCLVNVVDDPARCSFFVPAVVRQGALTIAVSTGGQSPALSRRIRQQLESLFDPAYGLLLDLLGRLRPTVQAAIPDPERRVAFWRRLLDSDALDRLRAGDEAGAIAQAEALLREIQEIK
ncbi:MAG: bifunctional precorrin-2 dehydrogenase/sirohydrochlorin ferrochelatase [Anaerolineales bacterium]|nr:MAG: bifunctional precorrin-2 dehydrogenase/sirohydrochlorin ferrochelatase [Anaerolineales bacterium]